MKPPSRSDVERMCDQLDALHKRCQPSISMPADAPENVKEVRLASEMLRRMLPVETQQFWMVIGGHVDLSDPSAFTDPVADLDAHGPYGSYEAAKTVWKGKTGWTVDDATMRYFIVPVSLPAHQPDGS